MRALAHRCHVGRWGEFDGLVDAAYAEFGHVDVLSGGAETGLDVASRLRWTRRDHRLSELGPSNQMLALAETSAHLDLLIAQGRVSMTTQGALRRCTPAA